MAKMVRIAIAVAAALAVGVLGLGPAVGQSQSERLSFTVGYSNDMDSWNPFVAVEAPSYDTLNLVYDTLLRIGQKDFGPEPGLAERWETSPDGRTWTFHIRQGVTWHDGEPLTAHDVVYTYNRVLEDEEGCCIDYLPFVESVTAPDDYTVEIVTRRPTVQMLSILIYILPEHIWKDISTEEASTYENFPPVGSGPFELVEWRRGQFWRLEANDDYWDQGPNLTELIFRIFNNEDAMVQALRQGEIDAAESIAPNLFNSLQGVDGITTHAAIVPSFSELAMNVGADDVYPDSDGHPALKDVRVRQAIAHAVDKPELLDKVLLGYGEVGSTLVPPTMELYHAEPQGDQLFEFDLERANQILDEAGYVDTDGDGIREMPDGGRPLSFRLFVRSEKSESVRSGQFIAPWLEEIGIDTDVQSMTDTRLTDVIYEGNFDMFIWGWFPDPDPDFILSIMTCNQRPPQGIWSDSFYCDPQYDEMYREQKTIADPNQRAELVKEMQLKIYEEAPYVILYYDADLQAYRSDRWTGFVAQPEPEGYLIAQYGTYSYRNITPVTAEAGEPGEAPVATTPTRGISPGAWIGIAAILVALGAVLLLVRRRRREEDLA